MVNKMHLFIQLEAAVERSSVASNNFLLSSVYELEARKIYVHIFLKKCLETSEWDEKQICV
jgi:hypothetical protein